MLKLIMLNISFCRSQAVGEWPEELEWPEVKGNWCLPYPSPDTLSLVPGPHLQYQSLSWWGCGSLYSTISWGPRIGPFTCIGGTWICATGTSLSLPHHPWALGHARAGFSSCLPQKSHPGCNRSLHSHAKSPPYTFQGKINFHWKISSPLHFYIRPFHLYKSSFFWLSALLLALASSSQAWWQVSRGFSPAGC